MRGIEQAEVSAGYAMDLANASYSWYRIAAIRSRRAHRSNEMLLIAVSASIPVMAVLFPGNTTISAVLGAAIVVLGGLRSIFHWHENYLRFSSAREAVEAERRLYFTSSPPYSEAGDRDATLSARITEIERGEIRAWVKVAAERTKS